MPIEIMIPVSRNGHLYEVIVRQVSHCEVSSCQDVRDGMLEVERSVKLAVSGDGCIWMPEAQYEALWALIGGDRDALGYRHMAIAGMPVRLIGDGK